MRDETSALEEFEHLLDRMNRQIGQISRSFRQGEPASVLRENSVAVDVVERDDGFLITADLPGFEKEDVDVRVTDHTLRINADRTTSEEVEEENYIRRERSERSISRTVALPDEIDEDSVKAELNKGVLSVTVPKTETSKARKVEIN